MLVILDNLGAILYRAFFAQDKPAPTASCWIKYIEHTLTFTMLVALGNVGAILHRAFLLRKNQRLRELQVKLLNIPINPPCLLLWMT